MNEKRDDGFLPVHDAEFLEKETAYATKLLIDTLELNKISANAGAGAFISLLIAQFEVDHVHPALIELLCSVLEAFLKKNQIVLSNKVMFYLSKERFSHEKQGEV